MLSDEEKKMLEIFKKEVEKEQNEYEQVNEYTKFYYNNHKFILNLIEKQSKEIEELKKPKYVINCKTNEITKLTNDFVSKDIIKEILGIEENIDNEKLLSLLQTIVDENSRLEDIEDRKVQIEYNNVFNKGVKSVEDKIKAKIEELENQKRQWIEDRDNKHKDSEIIYAIEVLQSLLEKE